MRPIGSPAIVMSMKTFEVTMGSGKSLFRIASWAHAVHSTQSTSTRRCRETIVRAIDRQRASSDRCGGGDDRRGGAETNGCRFRSCYFRIPPATGTGGISPHRIALGEIEISLIRGQAGLASKD